MKKIHKNFYQNMTTPSPHAYTHTHWPKSWGYVDFNMAANENALTQPKFELLYFWWYLGISQNLIETASSHTIFERFIFLKRKPDKKCRKFHASSSLLFSSLEKYLCSQRTDNFKGKYHLVISMLSIIDMYMPYSYKYHQNHF